MNNNIINDILRYLDCDKKSQRGTVANTAKAMGTSLTKKPKIELGKIIIGCSLSVKTVNFKVNTDISFKIDTAKLITIDWREELDKDIFEELNNKLNSLFDNTYYLERYKSYPYQNTFTFAILDEADNNLARGEFRSIEDISRYIFLFTLQNFHSKLNFDAWKETLAKSSSDMGRDTLLESDKATKEQISNEKVISEEEKALLTHICNINNEYDALRERFNELINNLEVRFRAVDKEFLNFFNRYTD